MTLRPAVRRRRGAVFVCRPIIGSSCATFLQQLSTDGGVAELSISLFARENFRLELSSDSLALLGRLRLSVALEVQPHAPLDAPAAFGGRDRTHSRDRKLIILSFRPLQSGTAVVVRGAHFRICSDGTLRGPDNTTAARYLGGLWHLGRRRHISFECAGPVYLRVTNSHGRRESIGPFASIRAADGAIFTDDSCLGVHVVRTQFGADMVDMWQEVSLLSSS